jgi:plasmid stabilization system protein ParE
MAKVSWTSEAERWLKDIYDYIAADSPGAAARVITGIYEKAQLLTQFPEIGYKYEKYQNDDVRILLSGHYRIAYLIRTDGNIDILGVFHGALDMQRYLL